MEKLIWLNSAKVSYDEAVRADQNANKQRMQLYKFVFWVFGAFMFYLIKYLSKLIFIGLALCLLSSTITIEKEPVYINTCQIIPITWSL